MKRKLAFFLILCLLGSLWLTACSFTTPLTEQTAGELTAGQSYDELISSIRTMLKHQTSMKNIYYTLGGQPAMAENDQRADAAQSGTGTSGTGYSQTNIQVEGVDEADLIKTDGSYLYVIASNRLYIVDVRQPGQMKVASSIIFKASMETKQFVTGESVIEMYLDPENNRLTLLISGYRYEQQPQVGSSVPADLMPGRMYYPYQNGRNYTTTKVYDISDKSGPRLTRQFSQEGSYLTSRKIGDIVTVVSSKYQYWLMAMAEPAIQPRYDVVEPDTAQEPAAVQGVQGSAGAGANPVTEVTSAGVAPGQPGEAPDSIETTTTETGPVETSITETSQSETTSAAETGETETTTQTSAPETEIKPEDVFPATTELDPAGEWTTVSPDEISLIKDGDPGNQVILASINTVDDTRKPQLRAVVGTSGTVYCSPTYLYLLGWRYEYKEPADKTQPGTSDSFTDIFRFSLKDGKISDAGKGSVPGTILNQFSLDEYKGYLRIATTTGEAWSGSANPSKNNIYILNSNLRRAGSLTGLAAGETIRSVRFMGDQAYVVTFRTTDPLFVLDLGNPASPQVLGKLKIPGYSAYLHPFGTDKLLGFGYDVGVEGDIAYEKGLKVSLFDIADLKNPKELSTLLLGSRGSFTDLNYNHKSLLFSAEKNLIAFPALLAKTTTDSRLEYGQPNFQGLIVLSISDNKINLRGGISHFAKMSDINGPLQTFTEDDMNAFYGYDAVNRGAYIGDTLFTFSNRQIRASSLSTLARVGDVELPGFDQQQYWGGGGVAID